VYSVAKAGRELAKTTDFTDECGSRAFNYGSILSVRYHLPAPRSSTFPPLRPHDSTLCRPRFSRCSSEPPRITNRESYSRVGRSRNAGPALPATGVSRGVGLAVAVAVVGGLGVRGGRETDRHESASGRERRIGKDREGERGRANIYGIQSQISGVLRAPFD
jgi:hypothetical protein